MRINHCLILAAGFGTRMGAIGQKLPKVLWPVFEKSLLELQVAYARSLGAEKIYINLHYMGEEIEAYCRSRDAFRDVRFLWEKPKILGIGGAIHNLAALPEVDYRGRLLVLNADQFFYLKKENFSKFLSPHADKVGVLFTYWVNSSLGYNALELDGERRVRRIVPKKEIPPDKKIETYTGISVIDLAKLDRVPGESEFFETVCPFEKTDVPGVLLENVDYWDFGTVKRYWETTNAVLATYRANSNHPFLRFLVNEKALKTWKIDLQRLSYNATAPRVVNLAPAEETRALGPCILLTTARAEKRDHPAIFWNELSEEVR